MFLINKKADIFPLMFTQVKLSSLTAPGGRYAPGQE